MCSERLNLPAARRGGQPPDSGGGSRTSTQTPHPSFVRRCPRNTEATKAGAPPLHGAVWPERTRPPQTEKQQKKESKSNQIQSNKTFSSTSRKPDLPVRSRLQELTVDFWLSVFLTKHTHLEKPMDTAYRVQPNERKKRNELGCVFCPLTC